MGFLGTLGFLFARYDLFRSGGLGGGECAEISLLCCSQRCFQMRWDGRGKTAQMILFCWLVIESELFHLSIHCKVKSSWWGLSLNWPPQGFQQQTNKGHLWVISLWWAQRKGNITTRASCKAAQFRRLMLFLWCRKACAVSVVSLSCTSCTFLFCTTTAISQNPLFALNYSPHNLGTLGDGNRKYLFTCRQTGTIKRTSNSLLAGPVCSVPVVVQTTITVTVILKKT